MPDRLKDLYLTRDSIGSFATLLKNASDKFDHDGFLQSVFNDEWKHLELKGRMHHIAVCLGKHLSLPYPQALKILEKVAPSVHGFEVMVMPDFVETFGLEDPALSLAALGFFTRFGSSEFAIRPFLIRYPEQALHAMHQWARDPEYKIRRLASEGSRPRLPWAMALPAFKKDPGPVLAILERLKNDPSEVVRRSVANNLNDIAKDHPDVVLDVCKRWKGVSSETDALLRHACRVLLKKGNREALRLFGFIQKGKRINVKLALQKKRIPLGGSLEFTCTFVIQGKGEQKVRLDYAISFAKKSGKLSRKVFKFSEKKYAPGKYTIRKSHSFRDLSTRRHYPGRHTIAAIANGNESGHMDFVVTPSSRP